MAEHPPSHCYVVLCDFGESGGGWGPLTIAHPSFGVIPLFYTGDQTAGLAMLYEAALKNYVDTGRPTTVSRFEQRRDLQHHGC